MGINFFDTTAAKKLSLLKIYFLVLQSPPYSNELNKESVMKNGFEETITKKGETTCLMCMKLSRKKF